MSVKTHTVDLPPKARSFVHLIAILGIAVLVTELIGWESQDLAKYFCYLVVGVLASSLRVSLPAMPGAISVSVVFILFGIVELSLPEAVVMGCLATLVQCLWHPKHRPNAVQILFNVTSMASAVWLTNLVYRSPALRAYLDPMVVMLLASFAFFVVNTFPVAAVIALSGGRSLREVWQEGYFWSLPYYLLSAGAAYGASLASAYVGWQTALLIVPVVYLIYRSYCLYLERLDDEKKHAEEMSSLHLRTIEALALAIDAKDHTTHDHLQRVQIYAIEIGKELGLEAEALDALRAASLLHDIGKLAVPEHIISKPGRLTPEEFEKMKIHPVVGAEILERVQFPYPVVPIVRSHHEKWDGTGYPDGLAGDAIPVGARILAVVDCLDALATDRQYRRALPLDEAMKVVVKESGKSFDPRIVDILSRRHIELEKMAQAVSRAANSKPLSKELKVERGAAPGAGFEQVAGKSKSESGDRPDFLSSIAAARQEVQALFELAQDLGNSLSLDETLSVLSVRLRKMVPHHSMAIWMLKNGKLIPDYVSGDDFRLFTSLEIPSGQGLSGWVAENRKPVVNGNPSVEPGYLNDPSKFSTLRSAMAVPLEGVRGVLGVLTLYHADRDAFTKDHLRILLAISSKVALSIENAMKYRQAESSATTDYLTGLPNARSLFLHLDSELNRARRQGTPVSVLVCDLDGFKQVNDRYGHLEGNRVLREVSSGFKSVCREYDYVARMGGDEFVVILPGIPQSAVETKVEQLRDIVSQAARGLNEPLGLSVGRAYSPNDGQDAEQLLAEADRRMYIEKQQHKAGLAAAAARKPWTVDWVTTAVQ
ncbi:MAG: diguanylate cyclase [Bryobacteraceae bacterium]|nr:diguanylate cyclase [Bryobacteraceae bacterium]